MDKISINGELGPLMDCMMASILMHFKETLHDCTKENFVIARIITDARKLGISVTVLLEWGALVGSDYKVNNCRREGSNVDENLVQSVSVMLEEIIGLKVSHFLLFFCNLLYCSYFMHTVLFYFLIPFMFSRTSFRVRQRQVLSRST